MCWGGKKYRSEGEMGGIEVSWTLNIFVVFLSLSDFAVAVGPSEQISIWEKEARRKSIGKMPHVRHGG